MKLILCIAIMLLSTKECDQNKTHLESDNLEQAVTTNMSNTVMQDNTSITYKASTRGFFLKIWVEGDSLSFTNDYNLEPSEIKTFKIPKKEKEELFTLLSQCDEKTLPALEAPSKRHQFDGEAMATLEISKGEDTYKTNTFDHGTPPKNIDDLVNKMLSIKTMMEKQ